MTRCRWVTIAATALAQHSSTSANAALSQPIQLAIVVEAVGEHGFESSVVAGEVCGVRNAEARRHPGFGRPAVGLLDSGREPSSSLPRTRRDRPHHPRLPPTDHSPRRARHRPTQRLANTAPMPPPRRRHQPHPSNHRRTLEPQEPQTITGQPLARRHVGHQRPDCRGGAGESLSSDTCFSRRGPLR
ncbi:MAG: hypothetical protein QOI29_1746 [Mycobacterium sp.]|jgi:hypothetical protein|nr:hypothetical protein [Mycobacterium sp.]